MDTHPAERTIIFFGRPGSGKGTQARLLAEHAGWRSFSTGNRFRELRNGTGEIAERVREAFDQGQLLPDWFAEYLFADAIMDLTPGESIVCEGFPRSLPQSVYAHDLLTWIGRDYKVVNLAVSDEEALRRIRGRNETDQRPDSDSEAKTLTRLELYRTQTDPALAFFKEHGRLIEVDGQQTPDEIATAVRAAIAIV